MTAIQQKLKLLSDVQLQCSNGDGHAMVEFHPLNQDVTWIPAHGYRISKRCEVCVTERHDVYNRNGKREYRRYLYPPFWVFGGPRLRQADVVAELARRENHRWTDQKTGRPKVAELTDARRKRKTA
jgi:hypothetical protein